MVLECVMMVVDNSDYSRNGDVFPNRLAAQLQCVSQLATRITRANQESSVGLMSSAGARCELLCTPTQEPSALFGTYPRIAPAGRADLLRALTVALLALKHRANKNQHERIVLFVASRVVAAPQRLLALAADLRRNHIRLDVVAAGCAESVALLRQLHEAVNSGEEAAFVAHSGPDRLLASVQAALGDAPHATAALDADDDPEYQLAVQLSLQEAERHAVPAPSPDAERQLLQQAESMAATPAGPPPQDRQLLAEVMKDLNLDLDEAKLDELLQRSQEKKPEQKDPPN